LTSLSTESSAEANNVNENALAATDIVARSEIKEILNDFFINNSTLSVFGYPLFCCFAPLTLRTKFTKHLV
jgi:hypothetical protein